MAKLISNRYASALFESGRDLDKIEVFQEELEFLKEVFEGEEKLLKILDHPKIKNSEKRDLIKNIFKDRISEEMINFLYILIDKRREDNILEIVDVYTDLYNDYKNIIKVVAITAVPMEDKSIVSLTEMLKDKLKKTIKLTNEVDSEVMGGVLLEVKNKVLDGTLKGQLESIGRAIQGAAN